MKRILILVLLFISANPLIGQEILQTDKLPELVTTGDGEQNVLLIGCMGCRWNVWEEFMMRNADKYKMYAVTFPGIGGTLAPNLPVNTDSTVWRNHLLKALSELIDEYELQDLMVVGHSWGTMVTTQLAALRSDVITKVVAIDGKIESSSWLESSQEARLAKANGIVDVWGPKLQNAEDWSKFNGASIGSAHEKTDSVSSWRMITKTKLVASFMAADRKALLQYWRENHMTDLTAALHKIIAPILNIQSLTGKDQREKKEAYLKILELANAPSNVHTVFMYDTKHFVMHHRPLELDRMIEEFVNNIPVKDYDPDSSEYFE